jgi:hypothetical protein
MTDSNNELLAGYLTDEEMAKRRGLAVRTLRTERQRGDGPPYVKDGKKIFYSITGFREWLKSIERHPVRACRAA